MKAAVVPQKGSKWEIKEVDDPKPGVNQVLIRIHASGLCYTDVHQTLGEIPMQYPGILGHEPVGEIIAVGEGVTKRKVGDRVGVPWVQHECGRCEWCMRQKNAFCPNRIGTSLQMSGGHAELMVAYAEGTMLIPDGLSYEQAAPIFCAGYTVYSGLRIVEPKPHERVAVVGIGGLGHLAVQYSRACGFDTIAVTHSADKKKLALDLGADHVAADGTELEKLGGADVILATSNSCRQTLDVFKGLRNDGRLIIMGFFNEPLTFSAADLLFKRARIIGSIQNGTEMLYEALDFAARGKVKVMAETFLLKDINKAYEKVAAGDVRFRAVVSNN